MKTEYEVVFFSFNYYGVYLYATKNYLLYKPSNICIYDSGCGLNLAETELDKAILDSFNKVIKKQESIIHFSEIQDKLLRGLSI